MFLIFYVNDRTLRNFKLFLRIRLTKNPSTAKDLLRTLLNNEGLPQLLEPNGIFVLEKRADETVSELKLWRVIRQKTYGATGILFMSHSAFGSAICN